MRIHAFDVATEASVARKAATRVSDGGSSGADSAAVATGRMDAVGPAQILRLQRTIGNAGVIELLGEELARPSPPPAHVAGTKNLARKAEEDEDDSEPKKTAFVEKRSPGHVVEVILRQTDRGRTLDRHDTGARSWAPTVVQRQAPPPGPDWVPPAGRAALNWLAVLHDMVPTGSNWGITHFDDAVIDITAYASAGGWNCVITKADEQTHQGIRLLPGQLEVTPALVAGERRCRRLKQMRTSLNSIASQGPKSGFYMVAAVQAHEDVHISQYRAGLAPHYTTLRTAIEALTVPFAGTPTAAAAKTAIKALPAYTTAMATFHAADVAENNKTGTHTPVAKFNTAEHAVVDPMIATIAARRTALGCRP